MRRKAKKHKPFMKLMYIRVTRALTQKQMAERLEINPTIYNRWEVGAAKMPTLQWYKMLTVFGLKEEDLPQAKDIELDVTPYPATAVHRDNGGTSEEHRAWTRVARRNAKRLGYGSIKEAEAALSVDELGDEEN